MMTNNFFAYSIKISSEIGLSILFFPVWWYTRGLLNTIISLKNFLANREKGLALLVWVKNLFKPMYSQTDWQGRLISFFMRLIQIIFRGIVLFFCALIALVLLLVWIALPIFIVYEIIYQLSGIIQI